MDTIIWLISNHQIYVGDFYKGELKQVPFEKTDSWEVYGPDDLEKLVDYMNYPLHYNQFKKSRLVILFDEVKVYEMLTKVQRCFKHCEGITLRRIEPLLTQVALKEGLARDEKIEFANKLYEFVEKNGENLVVQECLDEEEDGKTVENRVMVPMAVYEYVIELLKEENLTVETVETAFEYEIVLSPTTLLTKGGQKEKRYLQVEDVILASTLVEDGAEVDRGEALFKYSHNVQKMFGRMKTEEIAKQSTSKGKMYFVKPLDQNELTWVAKDEVIGIIGPDTSHKEEAFAWYKKNIIF